MDGKSQREGERYSCCELVQILPMRLVTHEHPADPSTRQGPHRASEKVQCRVRGVVIVAKDGAVDAKSDVIPVGERAIGPREGEKQCGPSREQDESREGLISPRPAHDE